MITDKVIRRYNAPPQTVAGALKVLEKRAFDAAKSRLIFWFSWAFLEETTGAERALLLLKQAQKLGLTEKTTLAGHTLISWTGESVPPTWAVKAALSLLRERQWTLPAGEDDVAELIHYLDERSP